LFVRRTFSAKTAKSHSVGSFQRKRLTSYLAISWGIPFIFVIICAILDGVHVVAIGYGKGLACWISNPTALLIVFATPVGLVLVYNIVAFSQTVYAINRLVDGWDDDDDHVMAVMIMIIA